MAKRKAGAASDQVVDVVEVKGSNFSVSNFIEDNQKLIVNVILGIAALVVLFLGYKYLYQAPKEKAAVNAMYKAEEQFAKDSFALALENPGGGFDGFLGIIDNYGGTKTGNLAKYYAGICYLNMGKFEDAIEYLNMYSPKDAITASMKAGALGDAHSELKDMDKAMSFYKKAAEIDNNMIAPYYMMKIAMLYYSQGKTKEATDQLAVITTKYPESPEFKEAEKLIARLQ